MNKKSSLIVLPLLIAVALTGCGKSSEVTPTTTSTSATVDKAAADKAAADKAAAEQVAAADKAAADKAAADKAAADKAAADKAAADKAAADKAAAEQVAAPPAAPQTDPRFSTCKEALAAGYGNYTKADPEYSWYQDRDGDGQVCEKK